MKSAFYIVVIIFPVTLSACGPASGPNEALIVAVASSAGEAVAACAVAFTDSTRIPVKIITGASGALYAQAMNGAPFDIFISADTSYPAKIAGESGGMRIYAYGVIALWLSPRLHDTGSLNAADVINSELVTTIAIADPQLAPYGAVAMEWLAGHGLDEKFKDKLVIAENISQLTLFITTNSVDAAITAASALPASSNGRVLPLDSPVIPHGAVILPGGSFRRKTQREAFMDYLTSERSGAIFRAHGYLSR